MFKKILVLGILLSPLNAITIFAQSSDVSDLRNTILQEGELRSSYFNVPHVGRMGASSLNQQLMSYENPDNSYLYFSSLIVGAKVMNMLSGEKMAITIPSAYRTARDGTERYTFAPLSNLSSRSSNTLTRLF